MLDSDIPLQCAQQYLNKYWKRPGYGADQQARAQGKVKWVKTEAARPTVPFQQRQGKAGAAAKTAAFPTDRQLSSAEQRSLAETALRIAAPQYATPQNVAALVSRINQESGGNPQAINLWDSNAKAGIPSKGILQTIEPTFNSYKLPGHDDIWNPLDNAVAAVRYMLARYGRIVAANGRGY
jgi:hypothetical protein